MFVENVIIYFLFCLELGSAVLILVEVLSQC